MKIRHVKNHTVHTVTAQGWERIQKDPRYSKLYVKEPGLDDLEDLPEVKAERAKQAAAKLIEMPAPLPTEAAPENAGEKDVE